MSLENIVMADIVIAAVLLLSVVIGARRGLVKSLAGVIIVVVAFVGASFIADALAEPVAEWMGPMVEQHIQEKLSGQESADPQSMLENFHFNGKNLQEMVDEVMEKVNETGTSILHALTESATNAIAYAVVYVLAFLALLLAVWLLMKPLQLATKLPGIHGLNALGGAALGLIWGALLVFVTVWVMLRFDWVLTEEMVEQSKLLYFFAHNSPVSLITSL